MKRIANTCWMVGRCYRLRYTLIFYLTLYFFGQTSYAITEQYPLEPPDTSSPRATMTTFMDNMNRVYQRHLVKDYTEAIYIHLHQAVRCLDLSEIAPNVVQDVGFESALLLKEIFDRIELPPYEKIPADKEVENEELNRWLVPHTAIRWCFCVCCSGTPAIIWGCL